MGRKTNKWNVKVFGIYGLSSNEGRYFIYNNLLNFFFLCGNFGIITGDGKKSANHQAKGFRVLGFQNRMIVRSSPGLGL